MNRYRKQAAMNLTKLLKNGIVLMLFVVCSVNLAAQETINTISFTWYASGGVLRLDGWGDKEFTIDWGDGIIEAHKLNREPIKHYYADRREYAVTIAGSTPGCRFTEFNTRPLTVEVDYELSSINLSGCTDLYILYIYWGQIQELDLSGCPKLTTLECSYQQITRLDLTGCKELQSLSCSENRLLLSDLFEAHLLMDGSGGKHFGEQNLPPITVKTGEELFEDQSYFDGIFTKYSVSRDGNPAPESDYTVTDGKLTFNTTGNYTVTMTNGAIISHRDYYPQVIVEITVEKGTGITETKPNGMTVYPNPASTEINVKRNTTETTNYAVYNSMGRKVMQGRMGEEKTLNIESLSKDIYYIRIEGKDKSTVSFIKN